MSGTINAGNAPPAPSFAVCARCGGAIEPGLERCPTCGEPQSRMHAPGLPGASLVSGLIGSLVSALGIFLAIALVRPDFFRLVGLGPLADWLGTPAGRRIWALVPMWFALMMANVIQKAYARGTIRKGWTPLARETGGRIVTAADAPESGAWTDSPEVRARAQRWLLTLDTERQRSNETTRLRAAVTPRRDFHLAIMPQSRILKAMTSPRIGRFLLRLGRDAAAGTSGDEAQRESMEELAFVVGPSIELGEPEFDHAFLIKSDAEGTARAVLGDLRGPLLALRRPGRWWQLTLTSSVANGRGMLEYREGGVVRDPARLEAVRLAMIRLLERLAADGIVAEAGPPSNT